MRYRWTLLIALSLGCGNGHPEATTDRAMPAVPSDTTPMGRNVTPLAFEPIPSQAALALQGPDAAALTLIRWWTDGCPHCSASLPAIETLRVRYESQGLATLAVHHPKPPGRSSIDVERTAIDHGYHGPVASDPQWKVLDRVWPAGTRAASSISLLIDREGRVLHAHPGPDLFPSDDPLDRSAQIGFEALELAIRTALDPAATD